MAGGNWTSQNKIRPGAYINFETEPVSNTDIDARGIVTMPLSLDWGVEEDIIELTLEDLYNGVSLAKAGFVADEEKALLSKLVLQNASVLKIFRLNKGGTKASLIIENGIHVEAKYPGTFGNKIAILITVGTDTQYTIQTFANGYLVDTQRANSINELVANDFVTFSGTGDLSAISSTLLTGGTNGTIPTIAQGGSDDIDYTDYFAKLLNTNWNILAEIVNSNANKENITNFIKRVRGNEGKYVQAVVSNYDADYEGIINNINGVVIDNIEISANNFCAWVAGALAGVKLNESLTGKVVEGATSIIDLKTSEEISDGLQQGEFLLSFNQNGDIKVEKDINSLYTFNADKNYLFSKNRVIRELDAIGYNIKDIWETTYLGRVTNNDAGRTLFKASIIELLTNLVNQGAIDDFDSEYIVVAQGNDPDSVTASIAVRPLDSMEFLYMTVNIID